jgi:hypothetical protein
MPDRGAGGVRRCRDGLTHNKTEGIQTMKMILLAGAAALAVTTGAQAQSGELVVRAIYCLKADPMLAARGPAGDRVGLYLAYYMAGPMSDANPEGLYIAAATGEADAANIRAGNKATLAMVRRKCDALLAMLPF